MSNTPSVEAVLFDWDGTLADSEHITVAALRTAWSHVGAPGEPPVERFLAMAGQPAADILARLGLPPAALEPYSRTARALVDRTRLFGGARELLTELRGRGVRVGVITGKDRDRIEPTMEFLGVGHLVEALVTPDDEPAPKPSEEGVWWLLRELDVVPGRAVLVGDSVADMEAGRAAGVRTIACTWGTGREDDLARCEPWKSLSHFSQLTDLLSYLTSPLRPSPRSVPGR
ncbi:HAD family hydrolase [Streptomyces scabiei]|uniref:Pyrophosphatase PpaX n=1 Tax=Streptomyces scabiei TaxID=1930 RepID=A0A124C580_STRSC|nr:HAD family hydrolase [Streptomyces scabiei]GAQ66757.1 pyrophosphatase PpaX [Streptomyces scabiei]